MRIIIDEFIEDTPSKKQALLKKLIGKTIKVLTRCSWDSFDEFDEFDLYKIKQNDFFRFSAGALIVTLDDSFELGFSSQEDICSIVTWAEKINDHKVEDYYKQDGELFLIKNQDRNYTNERERNLSDQKISFIKILKRAPQNAKHIGLANEVGVQIEFENGEILIMAHNLVSSSNSFAIAYRDEIAPEILEEITEIEIK